MKRAYRLKKNEEFQRVFQRGTSVANRQFVVYQLKQKAQTNIRFGISVSKKLGNAVQRNRIKRQIKEVLRDEMPSLYQDRDVIIIARKPVSEMNYDEIRKSLNHVLKVAKLFQKQTRNKMR